MPTQASFLKVGLTDEAFEGKAQSVSDPALQKEVHL